MANTDIRKAISDAGLRHWQIAKAAGISESTLCVWLRMPLQGERLERVQAAIKKLSGGGEND